MFRLFQLLEVALLEQTNGAFSELTTFDVCLELLHCSSVSMLGSVLIFQW